MRRVRAASCTIRSTAPCATAAGPSRPPAARAAIERTSRPLTSRRRSTGAAARSIGEYEGRLRDIIHALKYERPAIDRAAARRVDAERRAPSCCATRTWWCRCRCIPVASARAASIRPTIWPGTLGLPVRPLLRRVIATRRRRSNCRRIERHRNVRDAFALAIPDCARRSPTKGCSRQGRPGCGRARRRCVDDGGDARGVRAGVEGGGRERSAGAYSSPSRDRTALSTSADTASLSLVRRRGAPSPAPAPPGAGSSRARGRAAAGRARTCRAPPACA